MFTRTYALFTLILLLLLGACSMPATETVTDAAMEPTEAMTEMSDEMMDEGMADGEVMTDTHIMSDTHVMTDTMADDTMGADDMMGDSEMMTATQTMTDTTSGMMETDEAMQESMMDLPAWQTMPLTDARTGETFTLADYVGKTVFVETMATWCTNCRQQLGNVKSAVANADIDQVVFIAISVETDLAAETLAQYAEDNGFGWTFAVASPDLVRALADTFGPTIANPPATPHFLIHPDGSHGDLVTGFESGDAILAGMAS